MEKAISPNFADLLRPNIEIKTFPDGDSYVRIPDTSSFKGKKVLVEHRLYPNQNASIMQAIFIARALEGAGSIGLLAPYLPYSRQDKIWKEGEVKSAEILMQMLKSAGYSRITTFDCHFLKQEGEFEYGGMKIRNISLASQLISHAEKKLGQNFEVISPDAGAKYMSGGKGMKKVRRDYKPGEVAYRVIKELEIDFDVSGKDILIIDDMISTGNTMVVATQNLKREKAGRIVIAATHGFFLVDSQEKLNVISDYVFVSNTIPSILSKVNFMDAINE